MSKPSSSPLGPFQDGQKQPFDLTDGNTMRPPSCPQWICPGWYLTPDTSVLKARCRASGDVCIALIQMCDISPHFCLAGLFVAAVCVCVSPYDMHECPKPYSSTRLSGWQGKTRAERGEEEEEEDTQIHQWAFDSEPCIISRFISQLWRNRIIPVFGFEQEGEKKKKSLMRIEKTFVFIQERLNAIGNGYAPRSVR